MKTSPIRQHSVIMRSPIRQAGRRTKAWREFRRAKFEREKDEEGLIKCQDTKIDLPSCGVSRASMDLHHINGRDGNLLLDERYLVWLTRECHEKAHDNNSSGSSSKTEDDSK